MNFCWPFAEEGEGQPRAHCVVREGTGLKCSSMPCVSGGGHAHRCVHVCMRPYWWGALSGGCAQVRARVHAPVLVEGGHYLELMLERWAGLKSCAHVPQKEIPALSLKCSVESIALKCSLVFLN